jgi:DNA polymerase-3 subunit epsilon
MPLMVHSAPVFSDVAGHVAARVDGAMCVGHNLRFDSRMIGAEMQRVGIDVDWGSGLDTLSVTGCQLGQACADHGAALDDAHRDLADARTTAHLFVAASNHFDHSGVAARARSIEASPIRVCTRDGHANADSPAPYLAPLAAGLHVAPDIAPYTAKRTRRSVSAYRSASLNDFLQSIGTSEPVAVIRLEHTGVALVCVSCRHSWIAKRRSRDRGV